MIQALRLLVLLLGFIPCCIHALALQNAETTRSRLQEAFLSPSGKLTFSPELVLRESQDVTKMLLQSNAIQGLSEKIRSGKANVAFVRGSLSSMQTLVNEQENSRGSFPGPVPVVYCYNDSDGTTTAGNLEDVAEAQADGIMISVCNGVEIANIQQLSSSGDDQAWVEICQTASKYGLQPIPEVFVNEAVAITWSEEDTNDLVDAICAAIGVDPVAIVMTINAAAASNNDDEDDNNIDNDEIESSVPVGLPPISKSNNKRLFVLGSIRVRAGEGRLNDEATRFKANGFQGTILRSDCLPLSIQQDFDIVGGFWNMCITDLKSLKSKAFAFRAKNNMEKSTATKWANYQSSVIESGALGDPKESYSVMDSEAGDYKGF